MLIDRVLADLDLPDPDERPNLFRSYARRVGVPWEEYRSNYKAGNKWCGGCRQWFPRTPEFFSRGASADGLATRCRPCASQRANRDRNNKRPRRASAECHPDRPHHAHGQCHQCYALNRWRSSPEVKQRQLELRKEPGARARFNQRRREWRKENIGRVRRMMHNAHIRRLYNLARPDLDALVIAHQGRCAICNRQEPDLHIDHCHATQRVRGLLCKDCNLGIGVFVENPALLASAIRYLAR